MGPHMELGKVHHCHQKTDQRNDRHNERHREEPNQTDRCHVDSLFEETEPPKKKSTLEKNLVKKRMKPLSGKEYLETNENEQWKK